jgi:hypothetical protein
MAYSVQLFSEEEQKPEIQIITSIELTKPSLVMKQISPY